MGAGLERTNLSTVNKDEIINLDVLNKKGGFEDSASNDNEVEIFYDSEEDIFYDASDKGFEDSDTHFSLFNSYKTIGSKILTLIPQFVALAIKYPVATTTMLLNGLVNVTDAVFVDDKREIINKYTGVKVPVKISYQTDSAKDYTGRDSYKVTNMNIECPSGKHVSAQCSPTIYPLSNSALKITTNSFGINNIALNGGNFACKSYNFLEYCPDLGKIFFDVITESNIYKIVTSEISSTAKSFADMATGSTPIKESDSQNDAQKIATHIPILAFVGGVVTIIVIAGVAVGWYCRKSSDEKDVENNYSSENPLVPNDDTKNNTNSNKIVNFIKEGDVTSFIVQDWGTKVRLYKSTVPKDSENNSENNSCYVLQLFKTDNDTQTEVELYNILLYSNISTNDSLHIEYNENSELVVTYNNQKYIIKYDLVTSILTKSFVLVSERIEKNITEKYEIKRDKDGVKYIALELTIKNIYDNGVNEIEIKNFVIQDTIITGEEFDTPYSSINHLSTEPVIDPLGEARETDI
jgi:hypothetical protein